MQRSQIVGNRDLEIIVRFIPDGNGVYEQINEPFSKVIVIYIPVFELVQPIDNLCLFQKQYTLFFILEFTFK